MKDDTILWIIGIVILIFIIMPKFQSPEPGMIGLTPHYYKEGVEVFPNFNIFSFSVVTPPGGSYDQIAFSISGTAGDISFENIQIVDAFPLAFKNALPTTTQILSAGETKILWTSDLMDTSQFESVSPVNFWIDVSGENIFTGDTIFPERALSGDISFEREIVSVGSRRVFLFSIVSLDSTEYSVTCPGNAWIDLHNYGTLTTSSTLSLIDSFTATADLWTANNARPVYRFKFVGENTGDVSYSSERSPYYDVSRVFNSFQTVDNWRENINNMVGDTSYSVILEARNDGINSPGTCKVRNMNLGVIYLD